MFEKTKCLAFFASFARNHLFVVAFVGLWAEWHKKLLNRFPPNSDGGRVPTQNGPQLTFGVDLKEGNLLSLFLTLQLKVVFFWDHAANVDIWEACVRKMSSIFDWNLPHDHVKSSVDGLVVCLPETKGSWKITCCMRFQWNSSPSVYLSRCYRQQVTCFSIVFDILQTEWWLISQSNDLSVCDYVRGSLKH